MATHIVFAQKSANLDGSTVSGFQIVQALLGEGFRVSVLFGHTGEAIREFNAIGCSTSVVPFGSWLQAGTFVRRVKRILHEQSIARQIVLQFQDDPPDLVYVNSLVGYGAASAAVQLKSKVVWHIRELFVSVGGEMSLPPGGLLFVRNRLNVLADALIVNSASTARQTLGGRLSRRAVVIPNAVGDSFARSTPDKHLSREKLGLPVDGFVIGAVGSLRPVKGFEVLVRAMRLVRNYRRNVFLAIAGGGDSSSLRSIAEEEGVQHAFFAVGQLTNVREFYAACDLMVIPSLSESFGRVAIESFAAGVPVISSKVGGLVDIVDDRRNGRVFHLHEPECLAGIILEVLQDPASACRYVKAAGCDYLARYTEAAVNQKIISIVNSLLRPSL